MCWEYKTTPDMSTAQMNEYGAKGWELAAINEYHSGSVKLYWKRPVKQKVKPLSGKGDTWGHD